MENQAALGVRYEALFQHLDERQRRLVAAADAEHLGRGGVSMVARASGLSRPTIHKGLQELHQEPLVLGRVRREGAGRKRVEETSPATLQRLERLIDPATRGDPMSPLRWTVVNLIGATKTRSGLKIKARLDKRKYPTGIEVPDQTMQALHLTPHEFHGEWNYTLAPQL